MEPTNVSDPMPKLQQLLPNPQTPWLVSSKLFQKIQSTVEKDGYKKCPITSNDPEWAFILRYFEWKKPSNRSIRAVHCIHSPEATQFFQSAIPTIDKEAINPAFAPKWRTEEENALRQTVHSRWKTMTDPYSPIVIQGNSRKDSLHPCKNSSPLAWHKSSHLPLRLPVRIHLFR